MEREVVLKASREYGTRLPSEPVGWLLVRLPEVVLRTVRMRLEGRSTVRGVRPEWLRGAADIRVVDVSGADDAHIVFDCPRLGEGASELYEQRELWTAKPDPDLTGIDLVGDVVHELRREDRDSSLLDRGLLRGVRSLSNAVGNGFTDIALPGTPSGEAAEIDRGVIQTAESFLRETPRPEKVRVSGQLDMVRASTSAFALALGTGDELAGILLDRDVRSIRDLLGKPVIVEGTAVFRPSGNVLRVEASAVHEADDVSGIWSRVPRARPPAIERAELVQRQGPRSGVAAVRGAWPGDESDEEIARILEEIS